MDSGSSDTTRPAELQIDQAGQDGEQVVLTVAGELDMHTAPHLTDALNAELAGGNVHMVLECADLRFVDSSGLGVLVGAHKRASEQGGEVEIRNPSRILSKLLTITKLDLVFLRD